MSPRIKKMNIEPGDLLSISAIYGSYTATVERITKTMFICARTSDGKTFRFNKKGRGVADYDANIFAKITNPGEDNNE